MEKIQTFKNPKSGVRRHLYCSHRKKWGGVVRTDTRSSRNKMRGKYARRTIESPQKRTSRGPNSSGRRLG